MVVFGGRKDFVGNTTDYTAGHADCDADRIFVLDLTTMTWEDPSNLTPDGKQYGVPDIVTKSIGGRYDVFSL
jgi:hypothetical protein